MSSDEVRAGVSLTNLGQSLFDVFTYNVHASAAYAHLLPTQVPPPPVEVTQQDVATGRFDIMQELSVPFSLGPFRLVPYGVLDLTYYTKDLNGSDQGRAYGGGGLRARPRDRGRQPDGER